MLKEKKAIIKTRYVPSFFFALIAVLILFALYHSDSTLGESWSQGFLVFIVYILVTILVIFLIPTIKKKSLGLNTVLEILPAIIVWIMNNLLNYGTTGASNLTIVLWVLFCVAPRDIQRQSFIIFRKIWVIICFIGVFCYLCYTLKIPVPYQEMPYYFGTRLKYISYGFSFLYDSGNSLRLCGICNEPGYFGTICALVLCASRMNLKKNGNIFILIAGIFTFSAAFMMMIILYLIGRIIMGVRNNKSLRKKILRYAFAGLLLFSYIVILPTIQTGNHDLDIVLQRITINSEGISGDDRTTEEFDNLYASMSFSELFFGKGKGYLRANNINGSLSYKIFVLEYGILGCILSWGTLLVAALYKNTKNRDIVLFVLIFFASIYQRPNIITLPYLLLLIGGIEYLRNSSNRLSEAKMLDERMVAIDSCYEFPRRT